MQRKHLLCWLTESDGDPDLLGSSPDLSYNEEGMLPSSEENDRDGDRVDGDLALKNLSLSVHEFGLHFYVEVVWDGLHLKGKAMCFPKKSTLYRLSGIKSELHV